MSSSASRSGSREETSKKNEQILAELMKEEANKVCADCGQKGARWASWNLGVFLCIRCGGIHRKLGTHISRVKSVTLDTWTDDQIDSIRAKGNAIVNNTYNPDPGRFPFPSFSGDMEQYIRDKYERKLFMNSSTLRAVGKAPPVNEKSVQILNEMGFSDQKLCQEALRQSRGDTQRAVDFLLSRTPEKETDLLGSSPLVAKPPSNSTSTNKTTLPKPATAGIPDASSNPWASDKTGNDPFADLDPLKDNTK